MAKLVCHTYPMKLTEFHSLTEEELTAIDGIGEKLASSFVEYFSQEENQNLVQKLEKILTITVPEKSSSPGSLEGKTFVITGSLEYFPNRGECKERIEQSGGRVSGSVSKNTDFLVNNDSSSSSSKNKKAKELGIPIITEQELLELL